MPVDSLEVYPTCDIHLLDGGSSMEVTLRDEDNPSTNLSNSASTTINNFDAAVVDVSKKPNAIEFKPNGVGETVGIIRHVDGSITTEIMVRVRVFNSIKAIWLGNNQATVHKNEDNYVLTVYAKFDDDQTGDISGHPYLNFSVTSGSSFVDVNNTDDKGRITGKDETAAPHAKVKVEVGGESDEIKVMVREPLDQVRNTLELHQGSGNYKDKENILILSEGFEDTAADKALFDEAVTKIVSNLFDTSLHNPYQLLKDNFLVWKNFEGSPEQYVTVKNPVSNSGTPIPWGVVRDKKGDVKNVCNPSLMSLRKLVAHVGLPNGSIPSSLADAKTKWAPTGVDTSAIDNDLFELWKEQTIYGHLQARDSFFGLGIGGRFGGRDSEVVSSPLKVNKFYTNSAPARRVVPDRRRMPKSWNRYPQLLKYLSSLRYGASGDPNHEVFKAWAPTEDSFGDNFNFVCFLIKDGYYCGTNFGALAFTLDRKRKNDIVVVDPNLPKLDHKASFNSATLTKNKQRNASVMAHEYAHSLNLLDEYEGYDNSDHNVFPNKTSTKDYLERGYNLTHFYVMKESSSSDLDADKIPWNWHLVDQASLTVNPAFNQSGHSQIVIRVESGVGAAWQSAKTAGREVFLRRRQLNKDPNDRSKGIEGPLTINSITANPSMGDVIVLDGSTRVVTGSNPYPRGSVLLLPSLDGTGKIKMTVNPAIISHINGTGKPFENKTTCGVCNKDTGFPDTGISGFSYPTYQYETIGLYEGGGTYNCKVYRPSGMCKMRGSKAEDSIGKERDAMFSFIAKYIIVNTIDPTKLPQLNPYYP